MESEKESYLIVPPEKLTPDAFIGLVEEFILREGTDYGLNEGTFEDKKARLVKQLKSGRLTIVYSSATENCTIYTNSDFKKLASVSQIIE